jgi:hypothetical protein
MPCGKPCRMTGISPTSTNLIAEIALVKKLVSIPLIGAWVYGGLIRQNWRYRSSSFNPLQRGMGIRCIGILLKGGSNHGNNDLSFHARPDGGAVVGNLGPNPDYSRSPHQEKIDLRSKRKSKQTRGRTGNGPAKPHKSSLENFSLIVNPPSGRLLAARSLLSGVILSKAWVAVPGRLSRV